MERMSIVFLISILFCLSLTACVGSPKPNLLSETSIIVTQQPQIIDLTERKASHPWRIAFIPKFKFYGSTGKLSSYWQPAWNGAQQAAQDFGVQLNLVVAGTLGNTDSEYVEPQIQLVADLITQDDLDGIVIAPFDSDRLAPVVEKAIAAGIPVVSMDTPINSEQLLTFVVFDNYAAGKLIGEWVVQQLNGKGKVLILDGPQDQQNAIERRNGFFSGLNSGDIQILNTESADWEIEPAKQITAEWLQMYVDVDAIVSANDNMALGAAQAVADAERDEILITGFDATDSGLLAVLAGKIAATVDQMPDQQARLAIQLLVRHLETGEVFPSIVFLSDISLVTQENVDVYLSQRELK